MKKGVLGIFAILVLFAVLHLGFSPSETGIRATAATFIGGTAFLLMTMTIVLATRPRVLEDVFGGLDRMYQVHKKMGVVAGLLVLVHFFAAPKEMPAGFEQYTEQLVPSSPMGMIAMILLIISLAITLNRKIAYHKWRLPHKAMGVVYFLIIGHMIKAPVVFFDQYGPSGIMVISAAIIGVLAYLYSMFGMNKKTATKYMVEAVNQLERATEVVLSPIGAAIDYKPGQFAFVEFKDKALGEPHPFTISSAPNDDKLRFTMKVLGDWTRDIREHLNAGIEVDVRGPYGRFDCAKGGDKQVWLAGGIGITPFLSTIRALKPNDPREIYLVYTVREEAEALYLDELKSALSAQPNMKLILLQSNEGEFAKVEIMKSKLETPLKEFDYFLCGPTAMTGAIIKDLKTEGVSKGNIHTEAFEFR